MVPLARPGEDASVPLSPPPRLSIPPWHLGWTSVAPQAGIYGEEALCICWQPRPRQPASGPRLRAPQHLALRRQQAAGGQGEGAVGADLGDGVVLHQDHAALCKDAAEGGAGGGDMAVKQLATADKPAGVAHTCAILCG